MSPAPDSELAGLPAAADLIGDRWSLRIAAALLAGPSRFGDLRRAVPGIAPNILAARLRDLQAGGLVMAEPYCERPPRYVYELTERGRALEAPLRALAAWGERLGPGDGEPSTGERMDDEDDRDEDDRDEVAFV